MAGSLQRYVGASGLLAGLLASLLAVAPAPAADDYELLLADGRVTLTAQGAPVVRVLEDLGRQAGFEVVADIGDDVVFDAEFKGLSLNDSIKRVCGSVGYLLVHDPTTAKIRRVVLTPSRARVSRTMPRQANPPGWRPPPPPPDPTPEPTTPDIIQQQEDGRQQQDQEQADQQDPQEENPPEEGGRKRLVHRGDDDGDE